jgi:hypothetical protein
MTTFLLCLKILLQKNSETQKDVNNLQKEFTGLIYDLDCYDILQYKID